MTNSTRRPRYLLVYCQWIDGPKQEYAWHSVLGHPLPGGHQPNKITKGSKMENRQTGRLVSWTCDAKCLRHSYSKARLLSQTDTETWLGRRAGKYPRFSPFFTAKSPIVTDLWNENEVVSCSSVMLTVKHLIRDEAVEWNALSSPGLVRRSVASHVIEAMLSKSHGLAGTLATDNNAGLPQVWSQLFLDIPRKGSIRTMTIMGDNRKSHWQLHPWCFLPEHQAYCLLLNELSGCDCQGTFCKEMIDYSPHGGRKTAW